VLFTGDFEVLLGLRKKERVVLRCSSDYVRLGSNPSVSRKVRGFEIRKLIVSSGDSQGFRRSHILNTRNV
jgi:hypothetical protein